MNQDILDGLNIAFNEADLLGVEVSEPDKAVAVTLRLLTLDENAQSSPEDSRVSLRLTGVSRVCASHRMGRWDDKNAVVIPFGVSDLLSTVVSFGGHSIYGWEFFNCKSDFKQWKKRTSLDLRLSRKKSKHTISLFQESHGEDNNRHLDICIWFDDLYFQDGDRQRVDSSRVIAGGKRWWDALYSKDPRSQGEGIFPWNE